jgi:NADH-quinone oxidoreductase subunit M
MTIFFGSFQEADFFHRFFVIAATCSIVITAVYILRVVGKLLLGPVQDEHHLQLTDATWFERLSTVTLIVCIAGIGCFPNWISHTISASFTPIIEALKAAAI